MSDNPNLTAVGDEPIEARIVAWVLGDASSFEAAELERLCEERPELLVFRRRMRALHGLLTAAEAAEPDRSWQLPPEKRQVLDEIFGTPKQVAIPITAAKRRRRFPYWGLSVLAACLLMMLVPVAVLSQGGGCSKPMTKHAIAMEAPMIRNYMASADRTETEQDLNELKAAGRPQSAAPADTAVAFSRSKRENAPAAPAMPMPAAAPAPPAKPAMTWEVSSALADNASVPEKPAAPNASSPTRARPMAVARRSSGVIRPMSALSTDEDSDVPATPPPAPGNALASSVEESVVSKSKAVSGPAAETLTLGTAVAANSASSDFNERGGIGGGMSGGLGGGGAIADGEKIPRRSRATATRGPAPPTEEVQRQAEVTTAFAKEDATKSQSTVAGLKQVAGETALALEEPQTATTGLRSGDGSINRGSIDAILQLEGRTEKAGLTGERLAKEMPDAGSLAFTGKLAAAPEAKPQDAAAAVIKSGTGTLALDGTNHFTGSTTVTGGILSTTVNGGTFADLNGRVANREHDEKLGEDRKKLAEGPAAKMPTLGDLPVGGYFFDSNADMPAAGEPQPPIKNELAKQLEGVKDSKALEQSKPGQTQNEDTLRRKLYTADGAYNLGRFDQAKSEYEQALRVDPYNKAARKGLEQIANAKSSYYRAAYDHTRAELLMDVDKAWELSVPAESKPAQPQPTLEIIREFDSRRAGGKPEEVNAPTSELRDALAPQTATPGQPPVVPVTPPVPLGWVAKDEATKANVGDDLTVEGVAIHGVERDQFSLAEREMTRRQDAVVEADHFITEARDAYGNGDFQKAYANHEKALGLLPDAPLLKDRRDFLRESLGQNAVALAEQAARDGRADESRTWFSKALEWNPNNEAARKLRMIDPASETAAATEPYSTFSLSISDASFKTAQAAMAKGERPDPAGIRVEQFYNAVDYGDPAPGANEPVAATVEQAAHPVVPGRNLVRVALRTGATGRSAAQPLQLTLLVDQSGSMAREDRRAAMAQALTGLAGLLGPNDRVTVVGFSLTARMLADGMKGDQAGKLSGLVNQAASEGGTNLEGALLLAKQLAEARKSAGAQNRVVLFTDGAANLGNADPAQLAETVKGMRQAGLAFDVAGIGTSELNDRLLAELARHGNGRFYVVGATADANDGFARQLAGAFRPAAENVKVQVRFNPQRVGSYKLIGFEEHRLNKEDFRNDAVDAAELAAEEAGVALYQVEPLPTGTGELGEVSVRFRDAASGRMVERSWTIPYDSSAPAFDRAAPSLQLAGLALLAAEKLRGGPLGDAIDFSQFTTPQATVKQWYPNNRRVAEVLEMVGALR